MASRNEAFVEYQRPSLCTRTHKSSLDLPAPPACGRSTPDMRPARWSSHGHIRFRRDDVDDPAWRREQFPAESLAPQRVRAPWGVPDEALIQQKIGGWTARRGYLTSVILGTAPESPCAYPPGWRRSTGLKVTGSARDPVDEAAVKLAFLGFPWQYAYYGIDPEERPSTPTERRENERLNQTLHWPVSGPGSGRGKPYKKYDDKTNTWKTVYITLEDEEKIKWVDPNYHGKEAPYSINPGVQRRKQKVIYPDEGPRPASANPNPATRKAWSPSDTREDVWGGTDMGPRLPIDAAKSLGRAMYLDRSRQFASIMQRLDELERLARLTPIEGRELRALCMRENDELLVLHRAYEESVQDGIFVLRCRELLEDLMPVIFGCGSRNAEYVRSEAEKNMLRRHKDLRYRGVGH